MKRQFKQISLISMISQISQISQILQFSWLLLLVAAMTACQPKKDSVRGTVTPVSPSGILGGLTSVGAACAQGQSHIGAIFDNSQPGTFQDRVKSLLTATMYPQDVGTVGASIGETTGVRFIGTIYLDANGNVQASNSRITISVYDSIWANNLINNPSEQPIPIEFDPTKGAALSGQFNVTTGVGYILMKDSYGEIRFDGTISAQTFSGTVSFRNNTNVTGQAAASGSLGQFTINTCGIVRK